MWVPGNTRRGSPFDIILISLVFVIFKKFFGRFIHYILVSRGSFLDCCRAVTCTQQTKIKQKGGLNIIGDWLSGPVFSLCCCYCITREWGRGDLWWGGSLRTGETLWWSAARTNATGGHDTITNENNNKKCGRDFGSPNRHWKTAGCVDVISAIADKCWESTDGRTTTTATDRFISPLNETRCKFVCQSWKKVREKP